MNGRERSSVLDERALIAQLEEENTQMMREMTRLESQVILSPYS